MKNNNKDTNLISALANIEIDELAIEGQVQNALNLKVDSLNKKEDSKKADNKLDS